MLLFKVHVREASALAEFKAAPQNRHSKIKSAQGAAASFNYQV